MSLPRVLLAHIAGATLCVSVVSAQQLADSAAIVTNDLEPRIGLRDLEPRSVSPAAPPAVAPFFGDRPDSDQPSAETMKLPPFSSDEAQRRRAREAAAGDPGILIYPRPRLEPKMIVITPPPDVDPDMIIGNQPPVTAKPRRIPGVDESPAPGRQHQPAPGAPEDEDNG